MFKSTCIFIALAAAGAGCYQDRVLNGSEAGADAGAAGAGGQAGGRDGGAVGGAAGSPPGAGGSASSGGDGGVVLVPVVCDKPHPGHNPLRRLTLNELAATASDRLGVAASWTEPLNEPRWTSYGGYANAFASTEWTLRVLEMVDDAATRAVAKGVQALAPCSVADERFCTLQFADSFGRRAFRHELDSATSAWLWNTMGKLYDVLGYGDAVKLGAELMLLAPRGVLRFEGEVSTGKLDSFHIASRLSYLVLGTAPDARLLDVAQRNGLDTPEQITAQLATLLADPRAREGLRRFAEGWLQTYRVAYNGFVLTANSGVAHPTETLASMREEVLRAWDATVVDGDGKLPTLLTQPFTFVDANLAPLYGAPAPATGFARLDFDPARRVGVLGTAGWLAMHASSADIGLVQRGMFVRQALLCDLLGPEPPDVPVVDVPVPPANATTRQRFELHSSNPTCANCHKRIDLIGFGFEHFNAAGVWRDRDNGSPVDSTGEVVDSPIGRFDGEPQLVRKLASDASVHRCYAQQWFRYALGREEDEFDDACTLQPLRQRAVDTAGDTREILRAIVTSDAFRFTTVASHVSHGVLPTPPVLDVAPSDAAAVRASKSRKWLVDLLQQLYAGMHAVDPTDQSSIDALTASWRELSKQLQTSGAPRP